MNSAVETVSSSDLALKIREASADAVREFVAKSWAPATLRAYSTDWSVFQAWCDAAELEALPAKPMTLALFLADEARRGRAYATVARRVAAVGLVHMRHGVAPPVPSVEVSAVLKGIRKDPERPARSKKAALLEEHLCQMIDAIETDTHLGRRDRALLLIGWCGAFRRSELVALSWSDFEAAPGQGVRVTVRRSKTDPEGRGEVVAILERPRSRYCPLGALEAWRVGVGLSDGAVFHAIGRGDRVTERVLSASSVTDVVKSRVAAIGLDASRYSAHSLRAGFVTSSSRSGANVDKIQEVSRHRSVSVLMGYVRDGDLFRDHAGGRLLVSSDSLDSSSPGEGGVSA